MNLYTRFEAALRRAGDAPALICPDKTWSYAALGDAVDKLAGALAGLGISAGQRVLVQVQKTPQAVVLYLACLKAGAVYAPINTAYTAPEVAYFLTDLEPSLVVVGDASAAREYPLAGVRTAVLDGAGWDSGTGWDSWPGFADAEPLTATTPRSDDDVAAILYTSGTTGRSKGAMLSHGNLAANVESLRACWGWRADDVLLHALPIFHVHGLFVALHCALAAGTPIIFLPGFDTAAIIRELPRATVFMGVPTFYGRLLRDATFDAAACRRVRVFISGSAPLTEQTFAAFEARTGARILERYGMTETLMISSNPLRGERVAGSVGLPLPGVEARIANTAGKALPAGEVGGIEVRGPNVFKGYWRRSASMAPATAAEFRADGFFITGDLGKMDPEGRLSIVGRAKDVIISGGYNVYPKEVEVVLDELPEVLESAVIGVPHADFGEAVTALVVAAASAEAEADIEARLDSFLKARLAGYKRPKRVIRVDALPRNVMGKVQKNILRETYRGIFSDSV